MRPYQPVGYQLEAACTPPVPLPQRLHNFDNTTEALALLVFKVLTIAGYPALVDNTLLANLDYLFPLTDSVRELICHPSMGGEFTVAERIAPCGESDQCVTGVNQGTHCLGDWLSRQITAVHRLRTESLDDGEYDFLDPFVARIITVRNEDSHE
jgi:hypothetical protein